MKQFQQPLLTIFIIFATAYVLTLIGCAPSGDKSVGPAVPQTNTVNTPQTERPIPVSELKQLDPSKMLTCTDKDFSTLQSWSTDLAASESAIKNSSGKKKDDVIKLAQSSIKQCDVLQNYFAKNPCKKVINKNAITPDGVVKAYDGFRIHARCELTNQYLIKYAVRPDPALSFPVKPAPAPVSVKPPTATEPAAPPVSDPQNQANEVEARDLHECNETEFAKLKTFRAALDLANKNVSKLGAVENWKYEPYAVDSAATATNLCESSIAYHQAQPCKRFIKNDATKAMDVKIYTGASLRQQCQTVRNYNYEFAQHASTLIVPNARLMFDTSVISGEPIATGYVAGKSYGQCIISSLSKAAVIYNGEKTLLTEARVYPANDIEGFQTFVLVTAEGIKLECYGLNYQSAKTSKNEVVRLLKEKQTRISLSYELN